MEEFALDKDYTASFIPFFFGIGYVAKGTVFHQGKAVAIFEAQGTTLTATREAARAKAQEIHRRLKRAKVKKRSTRRR
jgi:hypothetical protein